MRGTINMRRGTKVALPKASGAGKLAEKTTSARQKRTREMTQPHPSVAPLPASVLEALARYDTPTICNAMEVVAPERRLIGYTVKPLVCPFPDLPPIVG
jgi:hypothetical protein